MNSTPTPLVEPTSKTSAWRLVILYAALTAAAIGVFAAIERYGTARLTAPPPTGDARFTGRAAGTAADDVFHVLLALATVIVAGRVLGALLARWRQPPVIGEVLAGIMLGPSLLGWLAPDAAAFLIPERVAPLLGIIAQLGIVLYMFLVGLELNPALLLQKGRAAIAVSHASVLVPFLLGAAFALVAYPRLSTSDVPFSVFALFLGLSMSVTAFPVLARILTDRGLSCTPLGSIALVCAATGDALAWCLLALVVGVAQSRVGGAVETIALTLLYVAVMFAMVRPILIRLLPTVANGAGPSRTGAAAALVALLLSALTTEAIGIHALFGAFLVGAIVPHDSRIARELTARMEDLVVVLLLPAFFAFTGLRTHIGLVSGWENLLFCAAIILLASVGKFGGSALAARAAGMDARSAAAVGILMNTRGLMELIVLNFGLDLKVISPTLFAMLVIMALVTTVATTPILDRLVASPPTASDSPPPPP